MQQWGMDYDLYTVTTSDDWELSLYRLTGFNGSEVDPDKTPILIVHGAAMDASSFIFGQSVDPVTFELDTDVAPVSFQLLELGYDVWMANNRVSQYSNVNRNYPDADDPSAANFAADFKAKYDVDWTDMGTKDLPAFIDKVLEVSGKDKLSYIGYSTGTTQLTYALSTVTTDYFTSRIERAIYQAACVFMEPLGMDYYTSTFVPARERGVYYWYGQDTSATMVERACPEDEGITPENDAACAFYAEAH